MAVKDLAAHALGAPGGINNTAYLFFVVALAFLFYVTVKGDLPKWLGLLGLGSSTTAPASGQTSGPPGIGNLPGLPALPSINAPTPLSL